MLSFRLGRIPVTVQPWFFVVAAVLGASSHGVAAVASWIAIVFVSVLLHELGHAGVGMAFGLEPRIDLHAMGGTTSWTTRRKLSTWQRVAISLAGPFAGFAVGGLVFGLATLGVLPAGEPWSTVVWQLLWVNVGWGIFNLLPMLPLDGGNVLFQLLDARTRGRGERPTRIASMVVAVATGVLVYLMHLGWWGALLVLSFFATNYQGLQALDAREQGASRRV